MASNALIEVLNTLFILRHELNTRRQLQQLKKSNKREVVTKLQPPLITEPFSFGLLFYYFKLITDSAMFAAWSPTRSKLLIMSTKITPAEPLQMPSFKRLI